MTAELSQVQITKQDPTWLRQTMVSFGGIVDTCNILDILMSMSRIQGVNLPHQLSRSMQVDQPALTPEPGQSPSPAETVTRIWPYCASSQAIRGLCDVKADYL